MGCGGSKAEAPAEVDRDRRRLSLSKSEAVVNTPASETRGNVQQADDVHALLDLFPDSDRRLSLGGQQADHTQKGFDNKKMEQKTGTNADVKTSDFFVGVACKKGLKPESPNQDDFFVLRVDDWGIYGVFDGHGPYGHDVSSFVHDTLPGVFVRDPNFKDDPVTALNHAFPKTQTLCQRAADKGKFDCSLSGTTATVVMVRDGHTYAAHVGDSRAVIASADSEGKLVARDLCPDHKPEHEAEKKRIQASGGQVRRLEGDVPHRVFVKGKMYPGLAMSRSLGDTVAASAGVTSNPEVSKTALKPNDRLILVCSDGVWEFITSQEAVDLVSKFPPNKVQSACELLAQESWKRWIQEEGNVVDDITVIMVWLTADSSTT